MNKKFINKIIYIHFQILVLFLFITFFSCCNKEKIEKERIPKNYFNIKVEYLLNPKYIFVDNIIGENFKATIGSTFPGTFLNTNYLKHRLMYSKDTIDHYFSGNYIEVEFDRLQFYKPWRWVKCLIGINKENKAFYLYWMNKASDSTKDGKYIYNWEICKDTDTLYSNLDLEIVKILFKEFKGNFIKKNLNKIILSWRNISERRFYDEIIFDNLFIGSPFNRYAD
ncbi:MAG: hypothetical protein HW421_3911 [Ignavibacteria bacterium]|nr:hypothetical protein [Ignavibacteria bacterium]